MGNPVTLMFRDIPVLRLDFDSGVYECLNEKFLPYAIKGALLGDISNMDKETLRSKAKMEERAITSFLVRRVMPLTRSNAKKLYQVLNIDQADTLRNKMEVIMVCKGVSITDDYWIRLFDSEDTWSDVSVRDNSLSEVVANIALHGMDLSVTGELTTPELTGQGTYPKAWRREGKDLWLYKASSALGHESETEIEVSGILDKTNVRHARYERRVDNDKNVCACKCMTTNSMSMLSALDFSIYCDHNGLDYESEYKRIDSEIWYKMAIVDYLIGNADRHYENHGFFVDNDTNNILCCHPLFDHNNAFGAISMMNEDFIYKARCTPMSIKQAAIEAMSKVDFHFTSKIDRGDFTSDEHYNCFMRRANQLGVQTKISQSPALDFLSGICK